MHGDTFAIRIAQPPKAIEQLTPCGEIERRVERLQSTEYVYRGLHSRVIQVLPQARYVHQPIKDGLADFSLCDANDIESS